MKIRFNTKDYVLWLHPLGLRYLVRVSKIGVNKSIGEYAIVSVAEKCLVCVEMSNLLSISEVAEKNKKIAMEMQGKKAESV